MSKIEDTQDASKQDDTREETADTEKIGSDEESAIERSDHPESSEETTAKEESEEESEEVEVKQQSKEQELREMPSREEASAKEETPSAAEEPAAAVTRGALPTTTPVSSGIVASETRKQAEPGQPRIMSGAPAIADSEDGDRRRSSGGGHSDVAVGEWNSLPVLVERLREALELSLAAGCRRGDEPTATTSSLAVETGVGGEISDRFHGRRSLELAVLGGHDEPEPKKDELKFLEDLLLSDIKTALSRLRETLERTDVATLAKHGGVSDPTSKLHLLRLVSSLLSRLQVPRKEENGTADVAVSQGGPMLARKRRPVRHTIGVSAEEIAYARKQLEESSADLARLSELSMTRKAQREPVLLPAPSNAPNGERHMEEIHDKCTKDAINQRQSLRDKNKDCRGEVAAMYKPAGPPSRLIYGGDRPVAVENSDEALVNAHQDRRWRIDDYREKGSDDEEQSRVNKLAAVLRQRAELIDASRCNATSNKFTTKKSKIKRANTVDIPSYLKLQAAGLDSRPGCVPLRRPINVGDKVTPNAANNFTVPSFQPRTENDKKFLALINRNNETQPAHNAAPVFKSFGYTKATDASSSVTTNENWNSRFSNIKTAFDKPSSASDENKLSPKPRSAKRFPGALQPSYQLTGKKALTGVNDASNHSAMFANANASKPDVGFRHAPSSLFRKIEKAQISPISPKSPPSSYHRDNVPTAGSTLREKAKMFDRDGNVQPQQPPLSRSLKLTANESSQKSFFPRPPWIETQSDRNETKSGGTVTENGRLDYRQFCKQFAPFIGKSTHNNSENARSQNAEAAPRRIKDEQQHRGVARRKDFAPPGEKLNVVDGKITFRMFPEKGSRIQQQRRPEESYREIEVLVRDKLDPHSEKDTFEPSFDRRCYDKNPSGVAFAENAMVEATLRSNDDHPQEAHVFRLVSALPKEQPSAAYNNNIYNNNNMHSYGESVLPPPAANHTEPKEPWTAPGYERGEVNSSNHHPAENPRSFVLDRNQNYHSAAMDGGGCKNKAPEVAACDFAKERPLPSPAEEDATFGRYHRSPEQRERERALPANQTCENYLLPKLPVDNRSQVSPDYAPYVKTDRDPFEHQAAGEVEREELLSANDSGLPEEQNIQNQDISADSGVVTRYTCAIATVASADVPETRPDTAGQESAVSSSPSPSQFAWSYSKLPPAGGNDATEDEIRRHNMLQQSLVRRLQNERAILSEHPPPVSHQAVPHQAVLQSSNFNRSSKFQAADTYSARRAELPVPVVVTGSLPVSPPAGLSAMNRVTTLKEQYEQPGSQPKPIQKERSPIPNGVSGSMDSSDKYLLSCSNKSSRSIVLSKSESWHQLALSNHNHPPSRPSQPSQSGLPPSSSSSLPLSSSSSSSSSSYLPKPPKPKSPSPFRMKKQYEASSSSDSVKKMENKIRRYFDNNQSNDSADYARDYAKGKRISSPRDSATKGLVGLSRSRTMPGICDEKLHLLVPVAAPQIPTANLNSADVDKVFDDIFEEATRVDDHRF